MAYRIRTQGIINALDPEGDCDPNDLDQSGMHQVEFVCSSKDYHRVHIEGIKALKGLVNIHFPSQYTFEIAYPEGAEVEEVS